MAYTATNDDLDTFHIIFMIVLFSILLQGSMLPWISRKLNMLVLSAITPDEVHGIKLVEKIIEKDSRYNNKLLSEISKKHNEIIIMIQRNGQVINHAVH